MERKKILEKIKKCLALSKSANEHEAAAALKKAHELMEEYNVSEADVLTADVSEKKAKAGAGSSPAKWEVGLANVVAEAFSCRVVFFSDYNLNLWKPEGFWKFIGVHISPELAKFAFDVLHRQLKKERAEYIKTRLKRCKRANKTVRADIFCNGWVSSVRNKVRTFAKYKPLKAVEAYMDTNYPALKTSKVKSRQGGSSAANRAMDDYFNGAKKGEKAQLNCGVAGTKQGELR